MNRWLASSSLVFALACSGATTTDLYDGGPDAASPDAPSTSTVSIDLGSCAPVQPCGGDPTGTWQLSGGCADDPLANAKKLCPILVVHSQTGTASGNVTFGSGVVTRNYQSHYAMDITVPTACLAGLTCAQLQTDYQAYIPNTACSTVTDGCRCAGSLDSVATQGSTYTTSNDEIVTGTGDHYAYCVSGGTMQYRHTSGPSGEIGSYTLSK